jgi:hypothetical protein
MDVNLIKDEARHLGVDVALLPGLTTGQAASALVGLLKFRASRDPVVITACDGVFVAEPDVSEVSSHPTIFLVKNYRPALLNPTAFSWARTDDAGQVVEVLLKATPPDENWAVLTGTFSFPTAEIGIDSIEQYLNGGQTVNGEFYLDACFRDLVSSGTDVRAVESRDFISFGTPVEYESFRYWQRTFHKWIGHPYKVTTDRLVQPHTRGLVVHDLSQSALAFWRATKR